jgi:outer membrane lipoprotein SlyB
MTRQRWIYFTFGILAAVLLLAAAGCQSKPAQPPAQTAQPAGPSPEQQALEQKIQDQEKQLADLEQRLKDKEEEEVDKLRTELDSQKRQLAEMKRQSAQAPAAPAPAATAPAPAPAAPPPTGETAAPPAAAAPAAAPVERAPKAKPAIVLAEGTKLVLRLQDPLSSKTNVTGDTFSAYLEKPVKAQDEVILPADTRVVGRVTESVPSGKVKGRARFAIQLEDVEWHGKMVPVLSNRLVFEADPSTKKDAIMIGAGSGIGAIIGGIAGGGKGAAIGAAVGGGAGTAGVLLTKGKEVEFPAETKFEFELQKDVTLPQ